MTLFKITWINYGELDFGSTDFCGIVYDVSNHSILYETCNDIKHNLRCDFGSIFDKIRSIVSSAEFQNEKPYEDGCDGAWYKFEYTLNRKEVQYEGYIYGLKCHEEVISLIESCAKSTLEDERKLLEHRCTDNEIQGIIESRKRLEYDFLDFWIDIEMRLEDDDFFNLNGVKMRLEDDFSDCWKGILSEIQLPNGFIKCNKCNSIIHNKYFKNRKYWGRDWLSDDEFGEYEVEYDSGECPVCGQLNNELPYTGIGYQPDDSLFSSDGAAYRTTFEEDKDRLYSASELNDGAAYRTTFGEDKDSLYSADELNDLFKHISDDDRAKIEGCRFKLFEINLGDNSGDAYYYITIFKDDNDIGKIDMQFHSSTLFDLIDDMEIKSTDTIPYYTYEMTLYKDSKEESNNIKNTFGNSIFRCKKCGKVFCKCNILFTNKD